MKIGDRANTEHGEGVIVDIETISDKYPRFGVKLDNNPFTFPIAYYFISEINKLTNEK
jgi:hypothetical protein